MAHSVSMKLLLESKGAANSSLRFTCETPVSFILKSQSMGLLIHILFGFSVVRSPGTLSFFSSELGLMIIVVVFIY